MRAIPALAVVLTVLPIVASQSVWSPENYFVAEESYTILCYEEPWRLVETPGVVEPRGGMRVSHKLTLHCFKDSISAVNVTIPYRSESLPGEGFPEVRTTAGRFLESRSIPVQNVTVVVIRLPEPIYAGDDTSFILAYYLSGTVSYADQTYWDKILGRGGNLRASFVAPRRGGEEEIVVEFILPSGWIVKKWGPRSGVKAYEEETNTISLDWHLTGAGEGVCEFWAVYGKAGVTKSLLLILSVVIVAVGIFLVCVSLWIKTRYG